MVWARILAVGLIVAGALDCVSTDLALGSGGAREANPVVAAMQTALGPFWLAPKMAVHGSLAWMVVWFPNRPTLFALSAVALLTALAAVNNFAIYFTVIGWP